MDKYLTLNDDQNHGSRIPGWSMSKKVSRKRTRIIHSYILHCKKSWRSSSTPASGDAGPNDTGVEQIFRHPCRKFYYKYRTFSTFFTSDRTSSLWLHFPRRTYCLQMSNFFDRAGKFQNWRHQGENLPPQIYIPMLYHCATFSSCEQLLLQRNT